MMMIGASGIEFVNKLYESIKNFNGLTKIKCTIWQYII